jgi:hypothetical protein
VSSISYEQSICEYEDFVMNTLQENQREIILSIKAPVTLTFDLVTPTLIGVIYLLWPINM